MSLQCLPRHPAVAYLFLVRRQPDAASTVAAYERERSDYLATYKDRREPAKAMEPRRTTLHLINAQLDRSNWTIQESIELQRSSAARQTQAIRIILPLVGVLLAILDTFCSVPYRVACIFEKFP